jgi:F-box protein 9
VQVPAILAIHFEGANPHPKQSLEHQSRLINMEAPPANSTEEELEAFRQRWRQEVTTRVKTQTQPSTRNSEPSQSGPGRPALVKQPSNAGPSRPTGPSSARPDQSELLVNYHDLPDREEHLKLGNEVERAKATEYKKEPRTALEHYERAVEREGSGKMGDSVMLYRKAFKMDARVHEAYKNKHFPPVAPMSKPSIPHEKTESSSSTAPLAAPAQLSSISELLEAFSQLAIPPAEPETDLSDAPPCPIAVVPGEILSEIFLNLAIRDLAAYGRLAQVCKRFAYNVMTEEQIWKRINLGRDVGFGAMHYYYCCDWQGRPLPAAELISDRHLPSSSLYHDLTPSIYPTYRSQFRNRPRIRFAGCYISTVNYQRPGANTESTFSWTPPVQVVTYYRYLRFFRDGTVISLLTTAEPANVVHHLTKTNLHRQHATGSSLPTAVMKDALAGRWRLSGAVPPHPSSFNPELSLKFDDGPGTYLREPTPLDPIAGVPIEESEGDLLIETEGVLPKYMWKMQFAIGSAGRKDGTRNNKLSWKGFWSYNRLTDDWGEFGLKNDKAYYWSRVRSYGDGA